MKVKIDKVTTGLYDVDATTVEIDGGVVEICFDKSKKISKYLGKTVNLIKVNGIYEIEDKVTLNK